MQRLTLAASAPPDPPLAMHVLLLSDYWPPEIGSSSHLTYELGESLVKFGHRVTVVTGFPRYNVLSLPQQYRGRALFEERMGGMRVLRVAVPATHGASKVKRGVSQLFTGLLMALRAMPLRDVDVIYTLSPPLPMGISAWIASLRSGASFVLGVQDLFPQSAVDLGVMRNPQVIRFFERMERFVYRKAGAVTVHSSGNREHVLRKGGRSDRVYVAENWVDTDIIRPGERLNGFRAAHGLGDEFIVCFAGTMGWSQGLGVVIEAARLLAGEPGLLFLLVGEGVERGALERQAAGLGNVRFLPMQPKERYGDVLAASDASLVVLRPEVATPVVPSKLMTIMASGRPVLASMPVEGDAPRIVTDAGCGIVVPAGDAEALARAVRALMGDPQSACRMGERGREHAEARFSRTVCVRRFESVLREAAGRTSRTSRVLPSAPLPGREGLMAEESINDVRRYFDWEHRKHPSCLLYDTGPKNFLVPSESYARKALGKFDTGLKVLEIGSGDSVDSITLAGSSNMVWGIDISPRRLLLARRNVENAGKADRILPINMDAHSLGFREDSFDLVLGNSVLLFLDKERLAAECHRVLKPGGRALFTNESMKHHPLLRLWRLHPRVSPREKVTHRIGAEDIARVSRLFSSVRHEEFYLVSVLLAPLVIRWGHWRPVAALAGMAHGLDRFLLRAVPRLKRYCWIAVIELRK